MRRLCKFPVYNEVVLVIQERSAAFIMRFRTKTKQRAEREENEWILKEVNRSDWTVLRTFIERNIF